MQLVLHPDAQRDIIEAADWYDAKTFGLGDAFLTEVDQAFGAISEMPETWPVWPGTLALKPPTRRYLLEKFAFYAVAYRAFPDKVQVLAIVHCRKKPFYWTKRAND